MFLNLRSQLVVYEKFNLMDTVLTKRNVTFEHHTAALSNEIFTLRSLIDVASQINVVLYKFPKINKRSLLNKRSPPKT